MSTLQTLIEDPATAGAWNLLPARSSVRFKNKTLWGLLTVNGEFTEVSGDGRITATAVSGHLHIRAASVSTGIAKRDEHLRSADFFDADNHPQISVEVTALEPTGEHTADLRATLTIRGVSQPLRLPATVSRLPDGNVQISARATVDRTGFGVSGNMVGMMPASTTVLADAVFARAG